MKDYRKRARCWCLWTEHCEICSPNRKEKRKVKRGIKNRIRKYCNEFYKRIS